MFFQAVSELPGNVYSRYRLTKMAVLRSSAVPILVALVAVFSLSYAVLTQLRTNSVYQSRSLDKILNTLEDDIAKNRAILLQSAQEPDENIKVLLESMVEAGLGISFVQENEVFVDATRP